MLLKLLQKCHIDEEILVTLAFAQNDLCAASAISSRK